MEGPGTGIFQSSLMCSDIELSPSVLLGPHHTTKMSWLHSFLFKQLASKNLNFRTSKTSCKTLGNRILANTYIIPTLFQELFKY